VRAYLVRSSVIPAAHCRHRCSMGEHAACTSLTKIRRIALDAQPARDVHSMTPTADRSHSWHVVDRLSVLCALAAWNVRLETHWCIEFDCLWPVDFTGHLVTRLVLLSLSFFLSFTVCVPSAMDVCGWMGRLDVCGVSTSGLTRFAYDRFVCFFDFNRRFHVLVPQSPSDSMDCISSLRCDFITRQCFGNSYDR
jgi:hypothetical protein